MELLFGASLDIGRNGEARCPEDSRRISMKLSKPIRTEDLQISGSAASSEEILKAHRMNYWLERISAEDMAKLWQELQDSVKDAQSNISLDVWASGTISNRAFRAAVTACTTGDGFVLTFTVGGISKSDGAERKIHDIHKG
jgi:hypothetical protein